MLRNHGNVFYLKLTDEYIRGDRGFNFFIRLQLYQSVTRIVIKIYAPDKL